MAEHGFNIASEEDVLADLDQRLVQIRRAADLPAVAAG
jgi:hypothetical protein